MVKSCMLSIHKNDLPGEKEKVGRAGREKDGAILVKGVNLINLDPNGDASPTCVMVFASPFQGQFLTET